MSITTLIQSINQRTRFIKDVNGSILFTNGNRAVIRTKSKFSRIVFTIFFNNYISLWFGDLTYKPLFDSAI